MLGSSPSLPDNLLGDSMDTKICTQCGLEKSLFSFYKNGNRLSSCCKTCHKENIKQSYYNKVDILNKYKTERGCKKCGEKRFYLLDFHHTDPNGKDFSISDKSRCSLEKMMKEIEKCDILCANCHREWHYQSSKDKNIIYCDWLGE